VPFNRLPVDVVGEYYVSRSLPLSAQSTINLYPEGNPSGRASTALQNWLGAKGWLTASGADRGFAKYKNVLYQVSGEDLYLVDDLRVRTSVGTVPGTARCEFANDGTFLIIVTEGKAYQFDGTTLSEITDPDLETPDSVAVLNNQVIYDGDEGRWVVASPADPDNIPAINYAIAESQGDDLIRVHTFNQTLYLMGSDSIETWFNSGTGSPPFTRIEGGILESKGLLALHSVAKTTNYTYFMDSDQIVSRVSGYQAEEITSPALAHEFSKLVCSDAIGMSMVVEGQQFYVISFPTSNKTFAFSETFSTWVQLSYGTTGGRHLMNAYMFIYGKHLISDYRNGNIYELDADTFTDNGEVQVRERVTPPINGISLGMPGAVFTMEYFEVFIETGVGTVSGQGVAPAIMFSTSTDGGRTFDSSGVGYIGMGEGGDYLIRVRYDCLIEFQELLIKIRVTDPAFISIHGAFISVKPEMGY